jgi:hypothetical protein
MATLLMPRSLPPWLPNLAEQHQVILFSWSVSESECSKSALHANEMIQLGLANFKSSPQGIWANENNIETAWNVYSDNLTYTRRIVFYSNLTSIQYTYHTLRFA